MSYSIVKDSSVSTTMPCPHISTKSSEESLRGIKKHFEKINKEPIDGEMTVDNLRDYYEHPLLGSSNPLLSQIYLADIDFEIEKHEELLVEVISHETLHILLYKLEGKTASMELDNLEI